MAQPAGIGAAANRELKTKVKVVQVLTPNVVNDDTDGTAGAAADMKGYESALLVAQIGVSGDTLSGSVKLIPVAMESDSPTSGFTAVAAADLLGAFTLVDDPAEDDVVQTVAYIGTKRYVKVNIDTTGTHTNGTPCSACVILGHPRVMPTA